MSVEEISIRLRARLQQEYGVDEAAYLMDRPPGGWADLVTNQSLDTKLDAKFGVFEEKLDRRFEAFEYKLMSYMDREFRAQTWRLVTAMFAAMGTFAAFIGATVALLRV
jgi:hypothetical protein